MNDMSAAPPATTPTDAPTTREEREATEFYAYDDTGRLKLALMREERLREALVNVRVHTGHLPGAGRKLLIGLLASIARICDEALATPQAPEPLGELCALCREPKANHSDDGFLACPDECGSWTFRGDREPSGERREIEERLKVAAIDYAECVERYRATDGDYLAEAMDVDGSWGDLLRAVAALASPDSAVGEPAEPPEDEREWRAFEAGYAAALGFAPVYHVGGRVVRDAFRRWQDVEAEEGGSG